MSYSSIDNKKRLFFLMCLLGLAMALSVCADDEKFQLSDMVDTISGFNVGEAYAKAPFVIDALIYFILFVGVSQSVLGDKFKGSGGKAVVVAMGMALSVALVYWSLQTGFTLGSLGPLAAIMFVIIIAFFIYRLVKGNEKVGAGLWMAIISVYVMIYVFFPELVAAMNESAWGRFALGILNVFGIIALPLMFYNFFHSGSILGGQGGGDWEGAVPSSSPSYTREKTKRKKDKRKAKEDAEKSEEEIQKLKRLEKAQEQIDKYHEKLDSVIDETQGKELERLDKLSRLLQELKSIQNQIERAS